MERADAAEQGRLEKEAKLAHQEAQQAEVEQLNSELLDREEMLAELLSATLTVDDYVDLEGLKAPVEHPPFDRPDLTTPNELELEAERPEPQLSIPEPEGLGKLFAPLTRSRAVVRAEKAHAAKYERWQERSRRVRDRNEQARRKYEKAEAKRLADLEEAQRQYERECRPREEEAQERNKAVDELIANLAYGDAGAVEEYVQIVLSNSVYPHDFPVSYTHSFAPKEAELSLRISIPSPADLSDVKEYRYQKNKDEIVHSTLSQAAQRTDLPPFFGPRLG